MISTVNWMFFAACTQWQCGQVHWDGLTQSIVRHRLPDTQTGSGAKS